MNTPLEQAIMTYFDAETGGSHNSAYTSVGGRFYNTEAEQNCDMPYIVFLVFTNTPDYYFQEILEDFFVQFSIYSNTPLETDTILKYLTDLFDNAALTISDGTCLICQRQSTRSFPDIANRVFQASADYFIKVQ